MFLLKFFLQCILIIFLPCLADDGKNLFCLTSTFLNYLLYVLVFLLQLILTAYKDILKLADGFDDLVGKGDVFKPENMYQQSMSGKILYCYKLLFTVRLFT